MKSKTPARWLAVLALLAGSAAACTARPSPGPTTPTLTLRSSTLVPYQTRTPTLDLTAQQLQAPSPTSTATSTPTLTPSPTPRTYVIKAGDDMSGIALRYRVKLEELKTANPSVNPRLLKIGSTLVIPGTAPAPASSPSLARGSPTPSPVPVQLSQPRCVRGSDGSATCFVLASNTQQTAYEGVSVTVRLLDGSGKEIERQLAASPLDLLKPGAVLPLVAYFPPPLPDQFQVSTGLAALLPASEGEKRYIPVSIENQAVQILQEGLAAEVNGAVRSGGDQDAKLVWVAAVGYNSAGEVIGVRRWQSPETLKAGSQVSFSLRLYSGGGD